MLSLSALWLPIQLSPSKHRTLAEFHFARIFVGDDLAMSLSRHEHYVSAMLQMKPGLKVLLIGSGNGDIAMELVRFADVDVIGVEFDIAKVRRIPSRGTERYLTLVLYYCQVRCATARVKAAHLSHRVEFRLSEAALVALCIVFN